MHGMMWRSFSQVSVSCPAARQKLPLKACLEPDGPKGPFGQLAGGSAEVASEDLLGALFRPDGSKKEAKNHLKVDSGGLEEGPGAQVGLEWPT